MENGRGRPRGRPRGALGKRVADRGEPAAGNLRVTRQTSKITQCGNSTVAKDMVFPGTDNVPSTLLDPTPLAFMPLRCSDHDAEREGSPEFPSQKKNHSIHHVIPQMAHLSADNSPEFLSQNENHNIHPVIPQKAHLSAEISPGFPSQNENHNIHPVIPQIAHLSTDSFLEDVDESSTVEGYEVRPEYVPVLRLIFAKYGDIAKDSDLQSPESLSYFLEMVCSIILKLQRSTFREVTSFQLTRMLEKIRDLEKEKFNVGWLRNKLEDIKEMKVLDNRNSELGEEKTEIEKQKKLLESCEADLAALQDQILLFQREVKEMTDKYEEGTRNFSKMKHRIEDAYEKDLVDGLL